MKQALIFIIAALSFACGGGQSVSVNGVQTNVPDPTFTGAMKCSHQEKTAKGVTVCSGTAISASTKTAIDQQLGDLFTIAQNGQTTANGTNNYHQCPDGAYHPEVPCFSTHATYHVWLLPRAPVCESPGFTEVVYSDPWPNGYDNDPNGWDKDPRVGHTLLCVAGFMAAGGGNMAGIAVPGMGVVDAVDQMPIVRYEGEHNLLGQVDQARYAATQYHYGSNGGHPILGDGIAQGLVAKPKTTQPFAAKDAQGRELSVTK